jgi:hypothetical protein
LTTCSGGKEGGMIGAGGGVCASDCDIIDTASTITPAMTFGMFFSRYDFRLPCDQNMSPKQPTEHLVAHARSTGADFDEV